MEYLADSQLFTEKTNRNESVNKKENAEACYVLDLSFDAYYVFLKRQICFPIGPMSCGGGLTGSEGSFSSPYYPGTYPNNANCTWIITVNENMAVRLTFDVLNTRYNHYVYVYDGPTTSSRLLSR